MNYLRIVSFFAILTIMLIATLPNPVTHANRESALLDAPRLPARMDAQSAPVSQKPPVHFAKAVTYDSGGYYATSVAIADVDGDGHPDLVVANVCQIKDRGACNGPGEVSVLLGNGDGTFQAPAGYSSGGYYAQSVAIADVNGDGKLDLLVQNLCVGNNCNRNSNGMGTVGVLLGNGDGTFQAAMSYNSGGILAVLVAVGDVNGDGHPDLAVANLCQDEGCGNGSVSVLLGNGDGTFQAPVSYNSGGYGAGSVVIGDVNGDGHPDLLVANQCQGYGCGSANGEVGVLLGNGDGTFQAVVTHSSGGYYARSVVIGDVNGDGHPDLLVANECQSINQSGYCTAPGSVGVFLGNGNGSFQSPVSYTSGGYGTLSLAIGDLNGDNKPDLILASCLGKKPCAATAKNEVSVLLGNGDGTFQSPLKYPSGGCCGSFAVAIGDLNSDSRPDLIVPSYCQDSRCGTGAVELLLNKTSATTTTTLSSSPNPSQVEQSVTFTAIVASSSPVPNNSTVTFYDGATEIGTATTTNGVTTLTTSFSKAKTYTIKATYSGDAFHKVSSGAVKQVVDP
jgi:hypothetical protein